MVETLTASVIIVVVFMIASMSFNNVFMNTVRSDGNLLENRILEIKYLAMNERLFFPFYEEKEYWIITAEEETGQVHFEVRNLRNNKEVGFKIEKVEN